MSFNLPGLEKTGTGGSTDTEIEVREPDSSGEPVSAVVGDIEFAPEFSDPAVSVSKQQRTAEHQIVGGSGTDDEFVVQALGENPARVTIDGTLYESQLDEADTLLREPRVYVQTNRWTGAAVPVEVSTSDTRMRREDRRLYKVTITLREIVTYRSGV